MLAASERNSRREAATSHLVQTPADKNGASSNSWKRAGSLLLLVERKVGTTLRLCFFVPIPILPLARPWGWVFCFSAEIGIRDYIINIHVTFQRGSVPSCREDGHSTRAPSSRVRDTCRRNRTPCAFGAQSRVLYMVGTISAFIWTQRATFVLSPSPSSFLGLHSAPLRSIISVSLVVPLAAEFLGPQLAVLNTIKTFNGN